MSTSDRVLGASLVAAVLLVTMCAGSKPRGPYVPDAGMARVMCGEFIKRRLHNPDSYEAVSGHDWPSIANRDGSFTVRAQYRAQNGFGAIRQSAAMCLLTYERDEWRLAEFIASN